MISIILILLFVLCFFTCFLRPINAQQTDSDALGEAAPVNVPVVASPDPTTAEPENVPTPPLKRKNSLWIMFTTGGPIGYILMLMSLVAVALMIEHSLTIRKSILMPDGLASEVLTLLSQGHLAAAVQKVQNDPSVLGQVLYAGMSQYEFGWTAVEKAAEEATAEQASRLYRKIEYLNVIGNIAPMLGLLGTVVGMVFAFQQLADSEGYARASDLAEGIYLALVTTVEGLVVAIPSLAAFSFFSNRIAYLIGDTTYQAEQVFVPIKRNLLKKKA